MLCELYIATIIKEQMLLFAPEFACPIFLKFSTHFTDGQNAILRTNANYIQMHLRSGEPLDFACKWEGREGCIRLFMKIEILKEFF